MIFSRNPARGSRVLNALALLGVTTILGLAFAWQFAYDEPPCPLCLLQRVAFMLAGVGLLLNLLIWNQHEPLGRLALGGLVILGAVWISRLGEERRQAIRAADDAPPSKVPDEPPPPPWMQ